jgi:hypothetical protein
MRQVVSLVKGEQAHFGYVEHDTGQIVVFADLLIDPARFGMTEAAALGTSLIDYLGLNGHQQPLSPEMTVGTGIEARRRAEAARQAELEEAEAMIALPPEPPKKTTNVGRPRKDGRPNQSNSNPHLRAKEYISKDWVVETINQYPEGITTRDVGERIWRTKLGHDGEAEPWVRRAVENRITAFRELEKVSGKPMPFVSENYKTSGGMVRRLLKPLPTTLPLEGAQ